jgi:hypothetical protein
VQAAVTHKDVGDLCCAELPRMVRLISEYQIFELLYKISQLQHTRSVLETAFVGLFTAILRYEIVIVNFSKSWSEKIKTAVQSIAASAPQQAIKEVKDCEDQVAKLQTFADREISDMRFQRVFQQGIANSQQLQEVSSQFLCSLKEVDAMQNRTAKHMETVSEYLGEMQRN